jgi:pimeloyl-ACP methyl ester carboxylesterase
MIEARQITVQGRRVRLWSGGEGPAMLLLHGGMTDAEMHWAPIWDLLAERFTVYAPDLPGFGASARLPRPTYPRLVAWIEALRAAIGVEAPIVVGNSFGGSLARLYAANHPDRTERLIILNGGSVFRRLSLGRRLLLGSPIGGLFIAGQARKGFGHAAVARMFADPSAQDPALLERCAQSREIYDILRHCSAGPLVGSDWPRVPTLVIWGEADQHVDAEVGRTHVRQSGHATYCGIPNAGHLPQLEKPHETAQAIFSFCRA